MVKIVHLHYVYFTITKKKKCCNTKNKIKKSQKDDRKLLAVLLGPSEGPMWLRDSEI